MVLSWKRQCTFSVRWSVPGAQEIDVPQLLCSRCLETRDSIPMKPPGKYGLLIQQQVCNECWSQWMATMPRIINHYQLNLGMPEDRAQLQNAMLEFLNLPG